MFFQEMHESDCPRLVDLLLFPVDQVSDLRKKIYEPMDGRLVLKQARRFEVSHSHPDYWFPGHCRPDDDQFLTSFLLNSVFVQFHL